MTDPPPMPRPGDPPGPPPKPANVRERLVTAAIFVVALSVVAATVWPMIRAGS